MSNMLLSHLHIGAAHIADNALCSVNTHMNRPMSPRLPSILANVTAKTAADGIAIFVRGRAVKAVGHDEMLEDCFFLLDLLFLGLGFLLGIALFGLDLVLFMVFGARLALDGHVGGFSFHLLLDVIREQKTWWHLWVGEQILERLSVNFIGHAVGGKECKFRSVAMRK